MGYTIRRQKRATTATVNSLKVDYVCVMLLWYLERQLLVQRYIYYHVAQCRHYILLTCIVKPARIRKTNIAIIKC